MDINAAGSIRCFLQTALLTPQQTLTGVDFIHRNGSITERFRQSARCCETQREVAHHSEAVRGGRAEFIETIKACGVRRRWRGSVFSQDDVKSSEKEFRVKLYPRVLKRTVNLLN